MQVAAETLVMQALTEANSLLPPHQQIPARADASLMGEAGALLRRKKRSACQPPGQQDAGGAEAGPDCGVSEALPLIASLGLSVLDAGPLRNAIALEAMTPVLLHLNRRYGGHASLAIQGLSRA